MSFSETYLPTEFLLDPQEAGLQLLASRPGEGKEV